MAEVRVIAPDGSAGTIPENELADARAQGFRLEGEAVGSEPVAPPPPADVRVRAPDGSTGSIPVAELEDAKAQGFVDLREEQYQTAGQKAATVGEGLARGATFGGSDVVQTAGAGLGTGIGNWVADKLLGEVPRATAPGVDAPLAGDRALFDQDAAKASYGDIQGRREANQALAIGSEIAGAVLPAIASGGVGSVAAAAKLTPAAQLANLATKMGGMLVEKAGASGLGRIGALAVTGAAEAAVDAATRSVMDDLARGDMEISSERFLDAAWGAAKWGGAIGGGLGAAAEGIGAAVRGGKALAEKVGGAIPSVEEFASGRAFKAVMGGANKSAVKKADKYFGGPEAVGKTALDEGIVRAGASIEDMAEMAAVKRAEAGQAIGDLHKRLAAATDGKGPDGADLVAKLDDYVTGLRDGVNDDVADAVASRLQPLKARLVDENGVGKALSFDDVNTLRKKMDERLNFDRLNPDAKLEAQREVRSVVDDFWTESADQAAAKAGITGFSDEVKALKRRYSHLALIDDTAQNAVATKLSNRFVSPTDHIVGGAAAIASGVATGGASLGAMATGAAGAFANKMAREHGNQIIAATLYKLAKGGVTTEKALDGAITNALRSFANKATTRVGPTAGRVLEQLPANDQAFQKMVSQARELQDPDSPASNQLDAMTLQLASESPEFAQAVRDSVMKKATFIITKLGPTTDPSDPLKSAPMPVDPVTKSRRARFMRAAQNPSAALDRLASGIGNAEDLAVVRELTPAIHKRFVDRVMKQVIGSGVKPSLAQRQKLHFALGVPVSRSQTPDYIRYYAALSQPQPSEQPAQGGQPPQQQAPSKAPGFNPKEFKVDNRGVNKADDMMSPGDS